MKESTPLLALRNLTGIESKDIPKAKTLNKSVNTLFKAVGAQKKTSFGINSSRIMKSFILLINRCTCIYLFIHLIILLPHQVNAQRKKNVVITSANSPASYQGINNGQYLKSWKLAGPIKV